MQNRGAPELPKGISGSARKHSIEPVPLSPRDETDLSNVKFVGAHARERVKSDKGSGREAPVSEMAHRGGG